MALKAAELEKQEGACRKENSRLKEIAAQHRAAGTRAAEAATQACAMANKFLGEGSLQKSLEARGHAEQHKAKSSDELQAAQTALDAVRCSSSFHLDKTYCEFLMHSTAIPTSHVHSVIVFAYLHAYSLCSLGFNACSCSNQGGCMSRQSIHAAIAIGPLTKGLV
jgi:hypothetical protein